jgi:hypothetical protein
VLKIFGFADDINLNVLIDSDLLNVQIVVLSLLELFFPNCISVVFVQKLSSFRTKVHDLRVIIVSEL